MTESLQLLGIVAAVNAIAFALMVIDKRAAQAGAWRISEATLLGVAFIGGAGGAICAQRLFRHKTRKEPFRTLLLGAAFANLFVFVILAHPVLRDLTIALALNLLADVLGVFL